MTASSPQNSTRIEASTAVTHALKLAGSLVVSFGITIAVRQFLIPRSLGAEHYGELNFADGFAGLFLVVGWLGVDTWLRKELGVTLKSADGVFGGILAVRTAVSLTLTAVMVLVLKLLGRSNDTLLMACLFGLAQLMVMSQNTASSLLHAAGKVDGLSIINVVGKVLWALAVLPILYFNLSVIWLAVAYVVSETFKCLSSTYLAAAHTGITLRVDLKATWRPLKEGLPYWINNIALAGMGRADVAVVGTLAASILGSHAAADKEVGWYTVVLGIGGMLMSVTPVIGWVLVPLLSRAVQRGQEEAGTIIRRAIEVCVVGGLPLSVGAYVAADELIALYKPEYAPSARVLRILAGTYVLTYLNVVAANCLAALGRGWTVTYTSLATLLLTPLLDVLLVPHGIQWWGTGGAAAACAVSLVAAETLTTGLMLKNLGRLAIDKRLIQVTVRTLLTAAGVIGLDYVLRVYTPMHPWIRVALGAVNWVVLALVTKSVSISEAKAFIQLAKQSRAQRGALTT